MAATRRAGATFRVQRRHTHVAHQTLDALAIDRMPPSLQLISDPAAAVERKLEVDLVDQTHQGPPHDLGRQGDDGPVVELRIALAATVRRQQPLRSHHAQPTDLDERHPGTAGNGHRGDGELHLAYAKGDMATGHDAEDGTEDHITQVMAVL